MKPKFENNDEEKLTKEDIKEFEEEIEQKLPKDYKEFLLENNGGVIESAYYRNFYYDEDNYIYISEFFPLDRILDEPDAGENEFEKNWLAIAEDGDSSYIFLSLEKSDYGKIYSCDMVHGNVEEDSVLIADSFSQLINNIERERTISDIQYFVELREFDKLKELIQNGELDVNYKNNEGKFLFNLIASQSPPINDWNDPKYKGTFDNTCLFIKFLYENGLNIDEIDFLGPLDIMEYILDLGYNINQKDKLGKTQLMKIAKNGFIGGVEFLLNKGADKNLEDSQGKNAYDYALQGFQEIKNRPNDFEKVKDMLK